MTLTLLQPISFCRGVVSVTKELLRDKMSRITEDLVRRRAEHNNCEITTLQELSLHQQEIERIEHLDRWCRELKILYLQNNLIPKIENVGRLKQLQYLNLALNNVERIENLEGCEFLEKLDLTVNFVGDLLSVESLRHNHHLRELYLTGNPCTDFEGYRDFVVATLPQLKWLDGREVSKSERILASQKYKELRQKITEQQKAHQEKRERERREHELKQQQKTGRKPGFDRRWYTDPNAHLAKEECEGDKEEEGGSADIEGEQREQNGSSSTEFRDEDERFWKEPVPFTPESRAETHSYIAEKRREKGKEPDVKGPESSKRVRRLERDGRMLNTNEGRYDFQLQDDEESNQYVLEVACPRFMDTSLIDCDVQPTFVRITMKGKILQLVLGEEVSPDRSSAQRSQTTGKLLVTIPKARRVIRPRHKPGTHSAPRKKEEEEENGSTSSHPLLEVDPTLMKKTDFHNIVTDEGREHNPTGRTTPLIQETAVSSETSEDFVDDPDVPPLL